MSSNKKTLYSPDLGFGRGGIVDRGAACGCLKRAVESTDGDFGTIILLYICDNFYSTNKIDYKFCHVSYVSSSLFTLDLFRL